MHLVEQPLEAMELVTLPQNVLIEVKSFSQFFYFIDFFLEFWFNEKNFFKVDIRTEVVPLVSEFAAILLTNAEVVPQKMEHIFPVRQFLNEFAIY